MRKLGILLVLLGAVLGGGWLGQSMQAAPMMQSCDDYVGRTDAPAPEFVEGLDWINTSEPLTVADLRGKIVVLDFWTYGCINCMHMIPTLNALEEKYSDELVVIGVHSAKFENEGQTENLREIVQRYEMHHPVINDADFDVWGQYRRYGVNAWPTFAVIDPRGNLFAVQSGEIPFEAFDGVIGNMATCFDTFGELDRSPIDVIDPELSYSPARALNYPGKLLVDTDGSRLFIADSVNHRFVIADLNTFEILDTIGTGSLGYVDGDFDTAQFYKPQGMALRDNVLYVADTFNHTLRAIDLDAETVTTIAGTGQQGRGYPRGERFEALAIDLRSPWDVEFGDDGLLYVAMAGTHQIWSMDLDAGEMAFAVGNGREAQYNSTLLNSELAQPSGLYFEDGVLYFADSESSTIRAADFNTDRVSVVSGTTDNNLFDYGDIDGALGDNRLQHALGVVGDGNGTLYIADTYNSKIKAVDLNTLETVTLFGGDEAGFADGDGTTARFNEPGGLGYADGVLYVIDTNNHALRLIDIEAQTVKTVTFPNPEALQIDGRTTVIGRSEFSGADVLDVQTVAEGEGEIVLTLTLPEGYKVNTDAASRAEFSHTGGAVTVTDERVRIDDVVLRVPVTFATGEDVVFGAFDVYYCEAVNETVCFVEQFTVEMPVTVTTESDNTTLQIERTLDVPSVLSDGGIG